MTTETLPPNGGDGRKVARIVNALANQCAAQAALIATLQQELAALEARVTALDGGP